MNDQNDRFSFLSGALETALDREDYCTASQIATRLSKTWPARPRGWVGLGRIATATLPLSEAAQTLSDLHERSPSAHRLSALYFTSLIRLGDVKKAQEIADWLLRQAPDRPGGLRYQARVASRKSDMRRAEKLWRRMAELAPEDPRLPANVADSLLARNDISGAIAILRSLEKNGQASPDNLFLLAQLLERQNGRWITLESSAAFAERYPDDTAVVRRHAGNLGILAAWGARRMFLESRIAKGADTKGIRLQYARALLEEHQFDAALQAYETADQIKPLDHRAIIGLARCHALINDFDTAHAALDATAAAPSVEVLIQRARLFLATGHSRDAARAALSAYRLCPGPASARALAGALSALGRSGAARRMMTTLETNFPDLTAAWEILAEFEADFGDTNRAVYWFERLHPHPRRATVMKYAASLWQLGTGERAWSATLAAATSDFGFLSPDAARRKDRLNDLVARLSHSRAAFEQSSGGARAQAASDLAGFFIAPFSFKMHGRAEADIDRRMRAFSGFERQGAAAAALAVIEDHLPAILGSIPSPPKAFNLLRRVGRMMEVAGRPADAIRQYEKAARFATTGQCGPRLVQNAMRKFGPSLKIQGPGRVAILILSWQGGLAEAERIAAHAHAGTGRSVITLTADPALDRVALSPRPYGHTLTVPCSDGYEALPDKLARAYRHIFACSNCTGLLKLDDDIAITDFEKFETMLRDLAAGPADFAGTVLSSYNPIYHMGRRGAARDAAAVAAHRTTLYCDGGRGYYLSRRALGAVFDVSLRHLPADTPGIIYEDAYFGELLHIAGIGPKSLPLPLIGGFTVNCFEPLALLEATKRVDFSGEEST